LISGLEFADYVVMEQFDAVRECRGGAFSAGFSRGFDVQRGAIIEGSAARSATFRCLDSRSTGRDRLYRSGEKLSVAATADSASKACERFDAMPHRILPLGYGSKYSRGSA
jgi:hypothetical protein